MNYEAALHYMEGLLRHGWKLGNDRFQALCARMDRPQDRYKIVHVAGTKGKGSTTALTAAILQHAGFRVGAYFSPYVYDVRERIQIDAEPISRAEFAHWITQAQPHIEALAHTDLGQTTEFELKTLIGFLAFAAHTVEYACIEVGIGGRLDATNVVHPTVTIITNIGLDHTQILGETHALIAAEKAGILKERIPCFTATDHPEALAVIERIASERAVPLTHIRRGDALAPTSHPGLVCWNSDAEDRSKVTHTPQTGAHSGSFAVATPTRRYHIPEMAMRGLYQRVNAACAIAAAEHILEIRNIALAEEAVQHALATTALPGRLTLIRQENGPWVALDGAHNALAAQALAGPLEEICTQYDIRRLFVVIGMLEGHAPQGVVSALLPNATRVYVCQPDWKRALPAEELAQAVREVATEVVVIPEVRAAVRTALTVAGPHDLVLITGSFYTVGEVSPEWLKSVQIP